MDGPFFFDPIIIHAYRNTDNDLRPLQPFAVHINIPLMQKRKAFYKGKPDTRSQMRFGDPVIALEQMMDTAGRDADAGICDPDIGIPAPAVRRSEERRV